MDIMWQKLNAVDILLLEKARIQLLSATQLVCSVPRSFMQGNMDVALFPRWDQQKSQFYCKAIADSANIEVALDIKDLVISISGDNQHTEHLVLSGITYPMAFGWMQIKLDSFGFKGETFTDVAPYALEKILGSDDEMSVFDQRVFDELAIYYANSALMLQSVNEEFHLDGHVYINPSDISMILWPGNKDQYLVPGFSLGSRFYPEPHFFIQINTTDEEFINRLDKKAYLWRNKNWLGLLLPAADFLSHDQDAEFDKVQSFFREGLRE